MNNWQSARRIVGCVVTVGLVACHSATTRIYDLDPLPATTRIEAYQAPALRVETVSIPASWDRIEILTTSPDGRLTINDFDHWSAPLAQLTRQTLSNDLERRLPAGSVIYPRLPKSSAALGLNVDILEFAVAGNGAAMHASWLIVPPAGSPSAKRASAVLHTTLTSASPGAVARAWSELLGQLADRIGADAAASNSR